jgi:hypothetical protein
MPETDGSNDKRVSFTAIFGTQQVDRSSVSWRQSGRIVGGTEVMRLAWWLTPTLQCIRTKLSGWF